MTIVVETITETNKRTGKKETLANRAYNIDTGEPVIVPCDTPRALGARWDNNLGWVLD